MDLSDVKCRETNKFKEAIQKGDLYDSKMKALCDSLNADVWSKIGNEVKKYRKNYSLQYSCNFGEICSVAYYHAIPKDSVSSVTDFFLYVYWPLRRIDVYCGDVLYSNVPVWGDKITMEYLYKNE